MKTTVHTEKRDFYTCPKCHAQNEISNEHHLRYLIREVKCSKCGSEIKLEWNCPRVGWWIFKFTKHEWSEWIWWGEFDMRSCNRCGLEQKRTHVYE